MNHYKITIKFFRLYMGEKEDIYDDNGEEYYVRYCEVFLETKKELSEIDNNDIKNAIKEKYSFDFDFDIWSIKRCDKFFYIVLDK